MAKLTKAQVAFLDEVYVRPGTAAANTYSPARKLVELKLIVGRRVGIASDSYTITPAGRAARIEALKL